MQQQPQPVAIAKLITVYINKNNPEPEWLLPNDAVIAKVFQINDIINKMWSEVGVSSGSAHNWQRLRESLTSGDSSALHNSMERLFFF